MGYVLVLFVFMASGEPAQLNSRHFPTLDACLKVRDAVPARLRETNEQVENTAVGFIAECVPFKTIPAGPQS